MNEIERAIKEFKELKYVSRDLKVEHINLAISALEKQVPKKPTNITELRNVLNLNTINYGICPSCKNEVNDDNNTYCHHCGQKIDWEVRE